MALVIVRDKAAPEGGGEPAEHVVDSAWLERWPDDFELVRYVVEEDAPAEPAKAPAGKPAPEPTPARPTFQ